MAMPNVLITPAEACDAWDELKEELGSSEEVVLTHGQVDDVARFAGLLAQADGAILGLERVDDQVLGSSTPLKVISRFGVGYDAIDLGALRERSIRLTNTPGCQPPAVARQTVAFLLAITFNLAENSRRLKLGEWVRVPNGSCEDTTLGIVGIGTVGREVASLALALGYRVVAYNRSPFSGNQVEVASSLEDLIQRSDVVTIHVALNSETRGLISGEALRWLEGKSLINTARGGIVSEREVLKALNDGTLLYYATDVFEIEPIGGISSELARHERVICTPHVAAMDPATARAMLKQAINNIRYCLVGADEKVNAYVL